MFKSSKILQYKLQLRLPTGKSKLNEVIHFMLKTSDFLPQSLRSLTGELIKFSVTNSNSIYHNILSNGKSLLEFSLLQGSQPISTELLN